LPAVQLRLVTWNLKGSDGLDVAAVAGHIRAAGADVVALQEVQRRQARDLARALGARSLRWAYKHQPFDTWPEGMAIVGVSRPVTVQVRALTYRWRPWSWRRRIALVGTLDGGLTLVNLHLSPRGAHLREAEIGEVLEMVAAAPGPVIVAGDLNERPDGPMHDRLAAAGLRDAWPPGAGDGATNWARWEVGTAAPPDQRIDYVYVSAGVEVTAIAVPASAGTGLSGFSQLSDHVPVSAVLSVASG
jgi:endonuclease/exonuclease/phosphatase family metal-dependent hydrolase